MDNGIAGEESVLPAVSKKGVSALRKGQWFRLAAIGIALLAILCYLVMPQILIAYQKYSNTSTAGVRDYAFPYEYISGISNAFGGSPFVFYRKSNLGPEVLVSQTSAFNFFSLALFLIALVAIGMDIWLTFTKKNEKWSKLVTLLFAICGLMAFMGPIFFLVSNHFGAADWTASSNLLNYWLYDSLYVHDAYGAIVTGLIFFVSAIAFGIGTGMEGGDRNDTRNQD
jgi:hypothetical protein